MSLCGPRDSKRVCCTGPPRELRRLVQRGGWGSSTSRVDEVSFVGSLRRRRRVSTHWNPCRELERKGTRGFFPELCRNTTEELTGEVLSYYS